MNRTTLSALLFIAMCLPAGPSSADDAGPDHRLVKILKKGPAGVELFNRWRRQNPIDEVNLRGADLRGANLRGADLSLADLSHAKLQGAVFGLSFADEYAKVEECRRSRGLEGLLCENALLVQSRVRMSAANLRGVNLGGAELDGADFTGAEGCDEVLNAPFDFQARCANPIR